MVHVTDMDSTTSGRIKEARLRAGLSLHRLAVKADVTPHTVIAWEKGDREPRGDELRAIADACGVDAGWLLTGERASGQAVSDEDAA